MNDLTKNVINQMTTSGNLLSLLTGMSKYPVVDNIHDEIVINVSDTVSEKLNGGEKYVERAMEQAKDLEQFVERSMKDVQSGKKRYY